MKDAKIKVVQIIHVPVGKKPLQLNEIVSVSRLIYRAILMKDGVSLSGVIDGGVYIFEPY